MNAYDLDTTNELPVERHGEGHDNDELNDTQDRQDDDEIVDGRAVSRQVRSAVHRALTSLSSSVIQKGVQLTS